MTMFSTPEFKVGVLVVVVSALIGVMSLKVAEGPGFLSNKRRHYFDVNNAGGLVVNSAVRMAGIKVGIIEEIELVDSRARVRLLLDREVPLTTSSRVELRADGILGDKHVELIAGDRNDPSLENGAPILSASDQGSLDNLINEFGKITDSLRELGETLSKATKGQGDPTSPVGRIILNVENLTKDISEMTGRNKEKINDIVDRVQSISQNIDQFIDDDSPEGFKAAWQKAIDSLSRIDSSLKNLDEITRKVNEGEGTIGRLVNDEETVEELNDAIRNVNEFFGGASQLQTSIDFHSEYLADADMTKSYLSLRIQPGLDRYYELGVIDDPKGVVTETDTVTNVEGLPETRENKVRTYKNRVKFTALFAKNFYDFTIKGGIIENSGGLGFDYYLLNKKLRFSVEAFDFQDLYVRAFAKYSFLKGLYLIGGGDNIFSKDDEYSTFIGGGIFLTNDDLKMFASKVSF